MKEFWEKYFRQAMEKVMIGRYPDEFKEKFNLLTVGDVDRIIASLEYDEFFWDKFYELIITKITTHMVEEGWFKR